MIMLEIIFFLNCKLNIIQ